MSPRRFLLCLSVATFGLLATTSGQPAQRLPGTENGEWRYVGGDAGYTRSSPLDQINAGNFGKLRVAWIWRGDNFSPTTDYFFRSTPVFVGGRLFTLVGTRRQVAAIDLGLEEPERRAVTVATMQNGVDFIVNGQLAVGAYSGRAALLMRTQADAATACRKPL